jgi:hypothetical protein
MPALVNISVGSLRGTSGDEATAVCPFFSKKPRKEDRISFTLCMARLVTRKGRLNAAVTSGKAFYRGACGYVHCDEGERKCPSADASGWDWVRAARRHAPRSSF